MCYPYRSQKNLTIISNKWYMILENTWGKQWYLFNISNKWYIVKSRTYIYFVSWIPFSWLSSKEIHKEDIKYWKKRIRRLMCEMQKCLPSTFFNSQEHYLIHQVEIELCGPVQPRSMWMIERHFKFLKGLIWQRTCPKDSMVEGYMVYQMMVYVTQYLPNLAAKTHIDCIWDLDSIKKIEGE